MKIKVQTIGGTWKGVAYMSYAEHDRCTRAAIAASDPSDLPGVRRLKRTAAYNEVRNEILAKR